MNGDGFVFTLKTGGASACGKKISFCCSTTISTEKVMFDCLSKSCALCVCTSVVLHDFLTIFLSSYR